MYAGVYTKLTVYKPTCNCTLVKDEPLHLKLLLHLIAESTTKSLPLKSCKLNIDRSRLVAMLGESCGTRTRCAVLY